MVAKRVVKRGRMIPAPKRFTFENMLLDMPETRRSQALALLEDPPEPAKARERAAALYHSAGIARKLGFLELADVIKSLADAIYTGAE